MGELCCLLSTSIYIAPLKIMVITNTFYQTYKRADADPLLWEASICILQTPRLWLPASNSLEFKSWPLLTAHCKSLQAFLFPCRQCDVISLFSVSRSLPPHLLWHSPLLFRINYLFTGHIYTLPAFLSKVALSLLHLCNPPQLVPEAVIVRLPASMCYAEPASDTVLPGYYREKCWFLIMLNNPVLGRVCKKGKAETQARSGPAARCSTELCDNGTVHSCATSHM